jgi:hypothetical protein
VAECARKAGADFIRDARRQVSARCVPCCRD